MTDFSPPAPIVANATPTAEQIATGLRQAVLIIAPILTMLGYIKWAGELNSLLVIVGPLSTIIVVLWGQWNTRKNSQDKKALAAAAPDSVGVVK